MTRHGAQSIKNGHAWWAALRHGGLLLSPVVLDEWLPGGLPALDNRRYRRLRDRFTAFQAKAAGGGDRAAVHEWLDALLEEFLGHLKERWKTGTDVPEKVTATSVTGQRLRPHRVLLGESGAPSVLVAVDDSPRVGMHRGRRAHARFVELLRLTGHRLGLLTNGRQFRLCYAGLDHDAWCEWEAGAWFAEGETRSQLQGLIALLAPDALRVFNGTPRLHAAVESSRSRQGELSQVLGDQVRRAVELLVNGLDAAARNDAGFLESLYQNPSGARLSEKDALAAIYQAATRLVMRLVVTFFAEARDLLPRSQPIYDGAYGVEGLFAQLESAARHEGLRGLEGQRGAWPRILGLFRLIHGGSHHEALPVPAYGGTLFRAGDVSASDPVLRAVALFEDARVDLSDRAVLEHLRLLKVGRIRVRRGTASAWVAGPVDFSDLRTEHIGIMYEGLLDYELRRVPTESPMLILGLGKEPVLPLSLLEGLSDRDLKDMIEKLAKEKDAGPVLEEGGEDAEDEEPEAEPAAEEEPVEEAEEIETEESVDIPDEATALSNRAMAWAMRAVEVGGLIRRPRGKKSDQEAFDRQKAARARSLLQRVLAPAEMYLVRWGGTRKGAGAFYTRPQLAVPTTHRTLEPLVYETVDGIRKPRTPEEILALKVCDLAMGSASFLIAALRYLTEALYESLLAHGRITGRKDESVVSLPFGGKATSGLSEELIPVPPDDERFERLLKARLKRYVVERCLYGVDINPLAVELARLSLWVETMDRELPFEFLDHRLKVGNSLVGCWFDRFQDYPALAWAREGGDGPKGALTKLIKNILSTKVKPELRSILERRGAQLALTFGEEKDSAAEVQEANLDTFRRLESMPITEIGERERIYREEIQGSAEIKALRQAFDRWCTVWFWPVGDENAPLLLPSNFTSDDLEFRGHHTELAREAVLCVIGQVAWQSGSLGALCGRGGSGRRGVRRIRGHVARRVEGAARDSGADFILVAGDTFEDSGVDRVLIQKVADIVGSFGGPVYVIPGNHDPLVPGSVWDHPAWKASAIVHVLREERPVEIPGGTLYPCPVRAKRSGKDPTAWIPVEEGRGIRIGLAHGIVEGVQQEEPDYPITRDAATRARLDYMALGHWHSTVPYAGPDGTTRMAFQGTSTLFPKLTCHAALATAAG